MDHTIRNAVKIAVCLKRVPDTETRLKVAADGKSLDPAGVNFDVSPYDEFGIEEALRIKEAQGGTPEVVVLCAGPAEAATQIRRALAMGADRGILVKGELPFGDASAAASALVPALKELAPDLCFFGKQAIDDDNLQVPAYVAAAMNWPLVTVVTKLEVKDGKAVAQRQVEGGTEVVEAPLPAAVSCQKGLNIPRFASLPNIMKAKKKPLDEKPLTASAPKLTVLGLTPPPARKAGRIVGQGADAAAALIQALQNKAKVI